MTSTELACVQPPPPLRKNRRRGRLFLRGGSSYTQAILSGYLCQARAVTLLDCSLWLSLFFNEKIQRKNAQDERELKKELENNVKT